jgi:dGTPase
MIRDSIDIMVKDLIKNTIKNIKTNKIKTLKDIYLGKKPIVCFSKKFLEIEKEIRFFLRTKMYDNKKVLIKNNEGKKIVRKLFVIITKSPKKYLTKEQLKVNRYRAVADYISGMTDRYAINLYKKIK